MFLGWMLAGPLFMAAFRVLRLEYRVRPSLPVHPRLTAHHRAPIIAPERVRRGRFRDGQPKVELTRVRIRRPDLPSPHVTADWWAEMMGDGRDSTEAMGD